MDFHRVLSFASLRSLSGGAMDVTHGRSLSDYGQYREVS